MPYFLNKVNTLAITLLGIMFVLMASSVRNDSAIMDELAHIPSGYSYVALKDMRLNPEHPPLIKDLAGIPLLFLDLAFPTDVPAWTEYLNGQWDMGRMFLYEAGNDADQILWWSRVPMMLLAILFGWILFSWTRRRFGDETALLALFLFAFSPTFIAHSRYVTTDIAAAFGFLIGLLTFIDFLEQPTRKNIIIAGIALGVAQLLKFSVVLLLPVYGIITLLWIFASHSNHLSPNISRIMRLKHVIRYSMPLIGKMLLIGIIAVVVIVAVYQLHVWNYPPERQLADATALLSSFSKRGLVDMDLWLIQHDATRALGQYMLGVLMVVQRAAGGNTTYFLGEVSNGGWWYYFPLLYLLKETAVLHMLTALAAGLAAIRLRTKRKTEKTVALNPATTTVFSILRFVPLRHISNWFRTHLAEASMLIFIAVYWWYSITSTLNIGVRHVLPTFPFIYILVSREITRWLHGINKPDPKTLAETFHQLYRMHVGNLWKYFAVAFFMFWSAFSVFSAFPHYLSYFNEFAGGSETAYRLVVDSNYDWGQDLKRLRDFTHAHGIERMAVDYFGGGSPAYYLGDAFEPWWSSRGAPEGYFAISATFRQGAFGIWTNRLPSQQPLPQDRYLWLREKEPVARVGESIFIYKFSAK